MAKKSAKTEEKAIVTAVDATFQQQDETVESRVEFEIKKFNVADAKILELKKQFEGLEIKGVEDKHGIKAVTEAISILRTMRTGVDKKHTELKAFYLNTGRGIDAEKNRIKELIAEIEDPLKAKKDAIDTEIQRIKDEEEAKEQKRLDDRVDALKEVGIVFDGSFYSIGESVSVDLLTIKDLEDEAFEKLVKMVQGENEKIQEAKRVEELHETRKDYLLPFWSFLSDEQRQMNYGKLNSAEFNSVFVDAEKGKRDFLEIQNKQIEESERLANERKSFNYEKRSFRLEKEGFTVSKWDGSLDFTTEIIRINFSKDELETLENDEFEKRFSENIILKNNSEKEFLELAETRRKNAEAIAKEVIEKQKKESRSKSLISLGFEKVNSGFQKFEHFIGENVVFDSEDETFSSDLLRWSQTIAETEKELHDKAEAERLAKLPDLEKIERYCQELMNVAVPQLTAPEPQEEIQALRDELKKAVDRALSNIKKLK